MLFGSNLFRRAETPSVISRVLERLYPTRLVVLARSSGRPAFIESFKDTSFLVVTVPDDEVHAALELAATDTEPPLEDHEPSTFSAHYADLARPRGDRFDARELRRLLLESKLFVLPLRKRKSADRPFPNRVTVGRASNNDIVIRDSSLSRFHAWFEKDATDQFLVGDARSKNGTTVGGEALKPLQTAYVGDGTAVSFGSIGAHVCSPGTYWDMVVLT